MNDVIEYSTLQQKCINSILDWYKSDKQFYVLAGYAGSGKSTIAKEIRRLVSPCYFAAYTGKAAHVLREKGISDASTIHGFLYKCTGKDENGDPIFTVQDSGLFGKELLVIDEYSMIGREMLEDILSKCPKVLFIGDPMQLPPIKENEQILEPDFFLDEIHRQSLESSIIKWAHEIRNGNMPPIGTKEPGFMVVSKKDVDEKMIDSVDQVICGRNDTRTKINSAMRDFYGFSKKSEYPVVGDKMICRKNNHNEDLYNGMMFTNTQPVKIKNFSYSIFVNGKYYDAWPADVLGGNVKYDYRSRLERFEYAYAMTCHKTQGSEFNSVLVYNESWGPNKINWLYTAVTRAKDTCILAL